MTDLEKIEEKAERFRLHMYELLMKRSITDDTYNHAMRDIFAWEAAKRQEIKRLRKLKAPAK